MYIEAGSSALRMSSSKLHGYGYAYRYRADTDTRIRHVGVVPNSLQDIGRASDGAKRRPVKAEGWAALVRVSWRLDSLVSRRRRVTQNS
jgi:hypothetical protein